MPRFKIVGQQPLRGTIAVSGAKNAALKMIAASVIASETVTIHNVPRIIDVDVMIELVGQFGVRSTWLDQHTLALDPQDIQPAQPSPDLVKKLRASFILVGVALSRFGRIAIPFPGGDQIGRRPVDTHLTAFKQLGVEIKQDGDTFYFHQPAKSDQSVFLDQPSVMATENAIFASLIGRQTTTVYGAATEPEIGNTIDLLVSMGARIKGKDTSTLTIQAQDNYQGGEMTVMPDRIEVGTLAMAALISRGQIRITNAIASHSSYLIPRLKSMGAEVALNGQVLDIQYPGRLLKATAIDTRPYPGFCTDLQSPMAALCTQAQGTSVIFETMYEGRFNYVPALDEMGGDITIENPHRIVIHGPTPLVGRAVSTDDIRAGAALVLAGLAAAGESVIDNIGLIDRGYERLDEKLRSLGAQIERIA